MSQMAALHLSSQALRFTDEDPKAQGGMTPRGHGTAPGPRCLRGSRRLHIQLAQGSSRLSGVDQASPSFSTSEADVWG